ncbi:MAG: hypothetical protein IT249_04945 [Chitinophagaceae bacterium]|nr:hypothetical protein [Chitinophagaceae bacterium]
METKEIKGFLQNDLEYFLLDSLVTSGFKWKKGALKFQRKKGAFEQSILFFFTPSKYQDDKSIGHLNIMIRFDSNEINSVATKLKGSNNKFDNVDTVVNVDAGLIVGSNAISWRPLSIEEMNKIIETEIKPLIVDKIIPFLDNRGKIQKVLKDFEANEKYFFWTSNGEVALRAIAMYSILNDAESAKKVANKYFLEEDAYRERYKNVLNNLDA